MLLKTDVIVVHLFFRPNSHDSFVCYYQKIRHFSLPLSNSDYMKLTKKVNYAKQPSVCTI